MNDFEEVIMKIFEEEALYYDEIFNLCAFYIFYNNFVMLSLYQLLNWWVWYNVS